MGIKIAEGSTHEIRIESAGVSVFISQGDDRWVKVHMDDVTLLAAEILRIADIHSWRQKDHNENN